MAATLAASPARAPEVAKDHGGVTVTTFCSHPLAGDRVGETHDVDGFISIDWLKANRIHYQVFGPTAEALAA